MNKELFNQLIQEPSNVDPKYKDELKELVHSFPYSSNIRMLYLSALLNDADVLFEQELKKSAAFITDRRVLKKIIAPASRKEDYLINNAPLKVVDQKEEDIPSSEIDSKPSINENNENNNIDHNIKETNPVDTDSKNDHHIEEEKPKISEENPPDKVDELDELIISSAIDASLSLEISEAAEELKTEPNTKTGESEEHLSNQTTRVSTPDQKQDEDSPKTFLEWIGAKDVDKGSPLPKKELERIEFKRKAELLIDQFIENQPKIKPKTEFYSPENMAQKSIEDNGEIVTETLAKVYANQGNIQKAKSIYKQLVLNNPEKKHYFASLLKNLGED